MAFNYLIINNSIFHRIFYVCPYLFYSSMRKFCFNILIKIMIYANTIKG